jgi:hypothetical protein
MNNQLAQLHKIAKVRERRAVLECQKRRQRHVAAEQACQEAVSVVNGLRQERENILSSVWLAPEVSGASIQMAIQSADHLVWQQQVAQKKVVSTQEDEAKAAQEWEEARSDQAVAMRACFKLDKALETHVASQRRAHEQRVAKVRDDDGHIPPPTCGS